MIGILDYRMGNLGSILNMLKRLGIEAEIVKTSDQVKRASRFILPGVGSFDHGMQSLRACEYIKVLERRVLQDRVPVLGICLGMQLMTRSSEEGKESGLGWIQGATVHFLRDVNEAYPVRLPHVGWNYLDRNKPHVLLKDLQEHSRFYFVHTYRVQCEQPEDVLCETFYSGVRFTSGFVSRNIAGVQFHPEKSHHYGMALLKSFSVWDGCSS